MTSQKQSRVYQLPIALLAVTVPTFAQAQSAEAQPSTATRPAKSRCLRHGADRCDESARGLSRNVRVRTHSL